MMVYSATELCALAEENISSFLEESATDNFVKKTNWDDELRSIDVAIILRDKQMPDRAIEILDHISNVFHGSYLVHHQAAVCAARKLDFQKAEHHADRTLQLGAKSAGALTAAACAAAINGSIDKARTIISAAVPTNAADRDIVFGAAQFIEYCSHWDYRNFIGAIDRLKNSGLYLDVEQFKRQIFQSISAKSPFSFVRLGDGEGAWLTLNARDEGLYSVAYRANRRSFLLDWFGTEQLIDDEGFRQFATNLSSSYADHDIIGIPPIARIEQEASLLSIRGLTSSINVFRFLDLEGSLEAVKHKFCSNSANLDLMYDNFFRELNGATQQIGLITSQTQRPPIFTSAGLALHSLFYVPGDSRNFLLASNGAHAICQYPDYVERINAELMASDQTGKVYLVAAGFVGKRYLHTIKARGGIALDIGSVADHIIKNPAIVR